MNFLLKFPNLKFSEPVVDCNVENQKKQEGDDSCGNIKKDESQKWLTHSFLTFVAPKLIILIKCLIDILFFQVLF